MKMPAHFISALLGAGLLLSGILPVAQSVWAAEGSNEKGFNDPGSNGQGLSEQYVKPISLDLLHDKVTMEVNRPTMELDLPGLVDLVLRKNLDISIANSQILQSKGRMFQSISQVLPSFTGQHSVERFKGGEVILTGTPISLNRVTYRPTLSADYNIDTGGKGIFQIRSSFLNKKQLEKTREQAFQQALLTALTDYFTWIKSFHNVELAQHHQEEAESKLDLARSRYKYGFGTELEITQAASEENEARSKLAATENQERAAEYTLLNQLNMPFEIQLLPRERDFPIVQFGDEDKVPIPELITFAEKHRSDVEALSFQIKAAKSDLAANIAGVMPQLQLNSYIRGIGPQLKQLTKTTRGYLSLNANGLQNLGVNTLGSIKLTQGKIQELTFQKEKLVNQIKEDLMKAYLDSQLYEQQIGMIQGKVKAAEATVRVADSKQRNGFGIRHDVLQAETQLEEVRFEHVTALTNYHLAKFKLLFQLGLLTPDYLKTNLRMSHNPVVETQKASR